VAEAEVLGGYRLQNLMGTGQTSQVWEVVEVTSSRHFAMKLLLPEFVDKPEQRKFLLHEAQVGLKLAHPNVIKIITVSKDPKNPYFVMEFFPAGSLRVRLMKKQTEFLKERMHNILKKAATGLAYMNASGWVHRDVKPDNILVNSAGEVRLIDFAIAKRIKKPSLFAKMFRRKGMAAGTRSYMSPEQIRNDDVDGRADIYSFGVTAFELVTGRLPFVGSTSQDLLKKHLIEKAPSPQMYNKDVTDEFAALVMRMMAKKREERPKDFHEVLMKLRSIRVFKSDPLPGRDDSAS
jgi:serine/threonine protein kinase